MLDTRTREGRGKPGKALASPRSCKSLASMLVRQARIMSSARKNPALPSSGSSWRRNHGDVRRVLCHIRRCTAVLATRAPGPVPGAEGYQQIGAASRCFVCRQQTDCERSAAHTDYRYQEGVYLRPTMSPMRPNTQRAERPDKKSCSVRCKGGQQSRLSLPLRKEQRSEERRQRRVG